jgi:hypothetical protein
LRNAPGIIQDVSATGAETFDPMAGCVYPGAATTVNAFFPFVPFVPFVPVAPGGPAGPGTDMTVEMRKVVGGPDVELMV